MGGLENLTKATASHYRSRGSFPQEGSAFTSETFSESPDRIKLVTRSHDNDSPMFRTLVLTKDKGWIARNGIVTDLDEEFLDLMRKARYADRVAGLVMLLRDKGFTLTLLEESQVKDRPVVGVKVEAAGQQDISLYFDKESGLLVKETRMTKDLRLGKEVFQEMYFSDYRRFDPAAPDEQLLQAARGSRWTVLPCLRFLSERTPSDETRQRVKALVAKLGDPSYRVREQSTAALKRLGLAAAPLLREAVHDSDREVSRRARQCLDGLADDPETALIRRFRGAPDRPTPTGGCGARVAGLRALDGGGKSRGGSQGCPGGGGRARRPAGSGGDARAHGRRPPTAGWPRPLPVLGRDGGGLAAKRAWRRVVVEGLLLANRCQAYRDGKLTMDMETYERQFYNRLDDGVFARPE